MAKNTISDSELRDPYLNLHSVVKCFKILSSPYGTRALTTVIQNYILFETDLGSGIMAFAKRCGTRKEQRRRSALYRALQRYTNSLEPRQTPILEKHRRSHSVDRASSSYHHYNASPKREKKYHSLPRYRAQLLTSTHSNLTPQRPRTFCRRSPFPSPPLACVTTTGKGYTPLLHPSQPPIRKTAATTAARERSGDGSGTTNSRKSI